MKSPPPLFSRRSNTKAAKLRWTDGHLRAIGAMVTAVVPTGIILILIFNILLKTVNETVNWSVFVRKYVLQILYDKNTKLPIE